MKTLFLTVIILLSPALASGATLTWKDNSTNEDGFAIENLQGGKWVEVARTGPDVSTWSDAEKEGFYRVRAFVKNPDPSAKSDIFSTYTNVGGTLAAPVNLTVK